jgi:hypothetical protein
MLTVRTAPSETERARAARKPADFWWSRAEWLAEWLARRSEVPLAPRLLFRRLPLATSHLNADDRRANPSQLFPRGAATAFGAAAIESDTDSNRKKGGAVMSTAPPVLPNLALRLSRAPSLLPERQPGQP